MQVKVSVVIPCYNGEKYLAQALLSIARQTIAPYEVILVDDCSVDKSLAIAQRYNVEIIRNPKNMGIGYTRQKGVEYATGTHIAFLSVDDYWAPEFLEHSVEGLARYDATYMGYNVINGGGKIMDKVIPPEFTVDLVIDWALKKNMFVNFSTILIPRLEIPQFAVTMRYGEDIIFLLDTVLKATNWGRVDHSDVYYRIHPEMGTNQLTREHFEQTWRELTMRLIGLGVLSEVILGAFETSLHRTYSRRRKFLRSLYRGYKTIRR